MPLPTPGAGGGPAPVLGDGGATEPPDASSTLRVDGLEPDRGPVTGGTEVVLEGEGFVPGMNVLLGQVPVRELEVVDAQRATFETPTHPKGLVPLRIQHPAVGGGEPVVVEGAFLYDTELAIDHVTPDHGPVRGGTPIRVEGTGFDEEARLFVGGREAIQPSRLDDGELAGITPPGSWGPVDVHVRVDGATAVAEDAYAYRRTPELQRLEPIVGSPEGGTTVRLSGSGLAVDAAVRFGGTEAEVLGAGSEGRWMDVEAPAGPPGTRVDVTVASEHGQARLDDAWRWRDPELDPYVLGCSHAVPAHGPAAGGQTVRIACRGLHYGVDVRFGEVSAEVLDTEPERGVVTVEVPSGEPGTVPIAVASPHAEVEVPGGYRYEVPSEVEVTAVEPDRGPPGGGTEITVEGSGFGPSTSVRIGALPASQVTVEEPGRLTAVTPPGSPGAADVVVRRGEEMAVAEGGFVYTRDQLDVTLVTPSTVARSGGAWLRIAGDGFGPETSVRIGGEEASEVVRLSPALLRVRSPALPVGTWDVRAVSGGAEAALPEALTTFDPTSGDGGTRGPPIDGDANVTVRGRRGVGPVAGAFVMLRRANGEPLTGRTDQRGEVTLSEPGLRGPVEVIATAPGFSSRSVVRYDARNITVFLDPTTTPSPGQGPPGESPEPLEPAKVSGRVIGLDKYVQPPPGSCADHSSSDAHCRACGEPEADCPEEGFACTDLGVQGAHCLRACSEPGQCPEGFRCGPVGGETRCVPSSGERVARCGLARRSVFGRNLPVPEGGVVEPGGTYEFETQRLGEHALVCFGGYQDEAGEFIPTVLGVHRHAFLKSGTHHEGLDVVLEHPLDRTFRFRFAELPTWPAGLKAPDITVSLDLGADGAVPLTRQPVEGGERLWLVPRQLEALTGNLEGSEYTFYTRLRAEGGAGAPTAYHLVDGVDEVGRTRMPVLDEQGWSLESSGNRVSLRDLWASSAERIYAVGREGRVMLRHAGGWVIQTTGVDATLRAVTGRDATDAFAAGEDGVVLRWDGTSWEALEAPADDYRAAATASGRPLWVASATRVRRWSESAGWSVAGPPWLQQIRALEATSSGRVAAVGDGGRVAVRAPEGAWTPRSTPVEASLRGVSLAADESELVAVGADGTVLVGPASGPMERVELQTDALLTDVVHRAGGGVLAVGEGGVLVRRDQAGWHVARIPDYRNRATAVFEVPDSGVVRVVGETGFRIGPFLDFPTVDGPAPAEGGSGVELAWSWDVGGEADYTSIEMRDAKGKGIWQLLVDGGRSEVQLPAFEGQPELTGLGEGPRAMRITRALVPGFDIDDYTVRDLGFFDRRTWSEREIEFQAP